MNSPTPEELNTELFNEIIANQQSLHEDMMTVLERLTALEETLSEKIISDDEEVPDSIVYEAAKTCALEHGKISISFLQQKLQIGFVRASRLMDMLEERGIIGPTDDARPAK